MPRRETDQPSWHAPRVLRELSPLRAPCLSQIAHSPERVPVATHVSIPNTERPRHSSAESSVLQALAATLEEATSSTPAARISRQTPTPTRVHVPEFQSSQLVCVEQLEDDINQKLRKLAEVTKALSLMWDQRFGQMEIDMKELHSVNHDLAQQVGSLQTASRRRLSESDPGGDHFSSRGLFQLTQDQVAQGAVVDIAELRAEIQARCKEMTALRDEVEKRMKEPEAVVLSRIGELKQAHSSTAIHATEFENLHLKMATLARDVVSRSELQFLVGRLDMAERRLIAMEAGCSETADLNEHMISVSTDVRSLCDRMDRELVGIDALRKVEEEIKDAKDRTKLDVETLEKTSVHIEAHVRGLQVCVEAQEQDIGELRETVEKEAKRLGSFTDLVHETQERTDVAERAICKACERLETTELEIEELKTGTVALATQGRKIRDLEMHKANRAEFQDLQEGIDRKVADVSTQMHEVTLRLPVLEKQCEHEGQRTLELEQQLHRLDEHFLSCSSSLDGIRKSVDKKVGNAEMQDLRVSFETAEADIADLKLQSSSTGEDVRNVSDVVACKVDGETFEQMLDLVIRYGRSIDELTAQALDRRQRGE